MRATLSTTSVASPAPPIKHHGPEEAVALAHARKAADVHAEHAGHQRHGQEDRGEDRKHVKVAVRDLGERRGAFVLKLARALLREVEIVPDRVEPRDGVA